MVQRKLIHPITSLPSPQAPFWHRIGRLLPWSDRLSNRAAEAAESPAQCQSGVNRRTVTTRDRLCAVSATLADRGGIHRKRLQQLQRMTGRRRASRTKTHPGKSRLRHGCLCFFLRALSGQTQLLPRSYLPAAQIPRSRSPPPVSSEAASILPSLPPPDGKGAEWQRRFPNTRRRCRKKERRRSRIAVAGSLIFSPLAQIQIQILQFHRPIFFQT